MDMESAQAVYGAGVTVKPVGQEIKLELLALEKIEKVKQGGFILGFNGENGNAESKCHEKVKILAFLVRLFGYAAEPIADRLQKKGGVLAVPPEAFYVSETEGPLLEGELERAGEWAKQILATLS